MWLILLGHPLHVSLFLVIHLLPCALLIFFFFYLSAFTWFIIMTAMQEWCVHMHGGSGDGADSSWIEIHFFDCSLSAPLIFCFTSWLFFWNAYHINQKDGKMLTKIVYIQNHYKLKYYIMLRKLCWKTHSKLWVCYDKHPIFGVHNWRPVGLCSFSRSIACHSCIDPVLADILNSGLNVVQKLGCNLTFLI